MASHDSKRALPFLSSRSTRLLSVVLLAQAAVFYGVSRKEIPAPNTPLSLFPPQVASWRLVQETPVDADTLAVLKADETLSRTYASQQFGLAGLFVAYFRSQRTGQAPHSPKNCLPGAGWVPSVSDTVTIPIDGRAPIEANRYVISKGESKSVVLYWYQSRDRVVASEYRAKMFVVADAIRYNRTDTALVRVIVPVPGNDVDRANAAAEHFVQDIFSPLRKHFPA